MVYNFTLHLSGADDITEEMADALFEAGCDDALLGLQGGIIFLEFDREGESLVEAILSAISDVLSAPLGLSVSDVDIEDVEVQDKPGISARRAAMATIEDFNSGLTLLRRAPHIIKRLAEVG